MPIRLTPKASFQSRGDRASLGNAVRDGDPKGSAESQTALDYPVRLRSADTLGVNRIGTECTPSESNTESTVDRRLMRSYLLRKLQEQQNIIDSVPVFSKRYEAAVDELEEIEELIAP
jgi:hypothetical protein